MSLPKFRITKTQQIKGYTSASSFIVCNVKVPTNYLGEFMAKVISRVLKSNKFTKSYDSHTTTRDGETTFFLGEKEDNKFLSTDALTKKSLEKIANDVCDYLNDLKVSYEELKVANIWTHSAEGTKFVVSIEQIEDKSESNKHSTTRAGKILESLKKRRKFNESAKTVESTRIKGYDSKKIKKNELGVNLDNLPSEVRFDFMWNPETERPAILARLNTEKFSGNDELKMVDMESNKTLATIKLEDAGMGLRTCTFNTEMHPKGTVDMFLTKDVMELINGNKSDGWYVQYWSRDFVGPRLHVDHYFGFVKNEKDAKKLLAAFKSRAEVKGRGKNTSTGITQVLEDLPATPPKSHEIEIVKSGKVWLNQFRNNKDEYYFFDLNEFI